jgi:hypothetical protein
MTDSDDTPDKDPFAEITAAAGMEDFQGLPEVLETPTPWEDLASNPSDADPDRKKQLRDAFNEDPNPATRGQLWELARVARGRPVSIGEAESGVLALDLLRRFPNPSDLVQEVLVPMEEQFAKATPPEERAKLTAHYSSGVGKDWPNAEIARAQLDDATRQQANERILQVLYGERYTKWRELNPEIPLSANVPAAEFLEVAHTPAEVHELAANDVIEIDPDQPSLIDRQTMRNTFGIDGTLLGVINIGDNNQNVSVGLVDIRTDAPELRRNTGNPFLSETGQLMQVVGDYMLILMQDGRFDERAIAGLVYGQTLELNRGHGEGFSALDAMLMQAGQRVPETVSPKQCSVTRTKDGRVVIRNYKPEHRTALELVKRKK